MYDKTALYQEKLILRDRLPMNEIIVHIYSITELCDFNTNTMLSYDDGSALTDNWNVRAIMTSALPVLD